MAFVRVWQLGLALAGALSLGACAEIACELGCDEEEADCLENPEAYVLGECAHASGPEPNACQKQFCENLHDECYRDCRVTDLSR